MGSTEDKRTCEKDGQEAESVAFFIFFYLFIYLFLSFGSALFAVLTERSAKTAPVTLNHSTSVCKPRRLRGWVMKVWNQVYLQPQSSLGAPGNILCSPPPQRVGAASPPPPPPAAAAITASGVAFWSVCLLITASQPSLKYFFRSLWSETLASWKDASSAHRTDVKLFPSPNPPPQHFLRFWQLPPWCLWDRAELHQSCNGIDGISWSLPVETT